MNVDRRVITDRIGLLAAMILLSYALTRIVRAPQLKLTLNLPGFYFAYPLSLSSAITLVVAGLAASGMAWLLHDHPDFKNKSTIEHWLIPTLTTFIVGGPLALLPDTKTWSAAFAFGALLLIMVIWAEYLVVSPASSGYALARAGLTAIAYALFLILIASMRYSGIRLFLYVPVLFSAAALISLRILHLDGADRWDFPWAVGIGLVCAQIGAGLHYWPIAPIQHGLALTGPLYALTMLSANLTQGIPFQRAALAPGIVLALAWGTAIFVT
jgi:hypothetical protein